MTEFIYLLVWLAAIAAVIGSFAGLFSIGKLRVMRRRLDTLEARLSELDLQPDIPLGQRREGQAASPEAVSLEPPPARPAELTEALQSEPERIPQVATAGLGARLAGVNWMVWLGGACVAIAGIFMARYSIENGLLGPVGRITAGLSMGLLMQGTAEWLRRRLGETSPSFAALAGGGSITLYATVLAGQQMYDLYAPGTAFVMLALIGLLTMVLAYLHGPVLAAMGMLGAYAVPILVSTGSGNVLIALVYSLIVSTSALFLLRYVYRSWLWLGFLAGALGWWLIGLYAPQVEGYHGWYLAILAYLILAVPDADWLIAQRGEPPGSVPELLQGLVSGIRQAAPLSSSLLLLVVAQALSLLVTANYDYAGLSWAPLALLLLLAGGRREQLYYLPWVLLALQLLAMVVPSLGLAADGLHIETLLADEQRSVYLFLLQTTAVFAGLGLFNYLRAQAQVVWSSLAVMTPILTLAVAYFLSARFTVSWYWAAAALPVGLIYLTLAINTLQKRSANNMTVWLFFGGHAGVSLALVMVLREASLTLGIALQLISLAWIIKRFAEPRLGWVFKGLVSLVIVRLTLNPWLTGYPEDIHWSIWTYGGATLCCIAAWQLLRRHDDIGRWAEGACLHLFALTLLAEIRYWCSDGQMFVGAPSSIEVALYVAIAGVLAAVYQLRASRSESLQWLYQGYSKALCWVAFVGYIAILAHTLESSAWVWSEVGETPLANRLLLLFGAPIVVALLNYFAQQGFYRVASLVCAGVTGFVFVSLEIRHLWQGHIQLQGGGGLQNGELYTYSAVWLLMATVTMLAGLWRFGRAVYKAGLLLLGIVVAKLFLWDMSDLEGLLRIASFMGLGLCLLGLAYLNQRLAPAAIDS